MLAAIHQALGAASTCWDPDGVFDSARCLTIADRLMDDVDRYARGVAEIALDATFSVVQADLPGGTP